MHQPKMDYRIWQRGSEWHWQIMLADSAAVLASGIEKSSTAARTAAFAFCLEAQKNDHN